MRRTALLLMLGITLSAGSMAAQTTLPTDPGLYVRTSSHFTKILGQIVTFERTGSLVASGLTGGIVSRKGNVQLLGAHAQTVTGTKPAFYFIPAKQEADTGGSAGDLVLIRLLIPPQPGDRRQFETGAQGYGRASTGISITHQIQLLRSEVTPGIYKLTPADSLHRGEYAFYLARGEGMAPYVYDFSVEGDVKIGLSDKSRVPVADILKTAGKATDCEDVIWVTEEGAPFTAAEVRSAGALPGNATPFDYRLEVRKSARDFALTLFNPDGAVVHETEANTLDNALTPYVPRNGFGCCY